MAISFRWTHPQIARDFRTAVSLHSHTSCSREPLDFIPRYAARVPLLAAAVAHQARRYRQIHGRALDFSGIWWTPPLAPREAYELERAQAEQDLGLRALVSLSDHDDIQAPMLLSILPGLRGIPISVEWTVPYSGTFLHIGVHNLPRLWAPHVLARLAAYTAEPCEHDLPELFSILHGFPSTLIVLNHPLWDEKGVGETLHRAAMTKLLARHHEWIHAIELNGLRPWPENQQAAALAASAGLPVISGGDRHGCEPNACVNLTDAVTFAEFAAEVRHHRRSHVLFLDQYRRPMARRIFAGIQDALRDQGGLRWTDRVFFKSGAAVRPLSAVWSGDGPAPVKLFVGGVRLLGSRPVQSVLRCAGVRGEVATWFRRGGLPSSATRSTK